MAAHRRRDCAHSVGRTEESVGQEAVLDVRGLTKRYQTVLAVDDVTFAIQPGEILGYLGPNGRGLQA
jgi:ABC-type sugar transport system ATPase subunit